MYDGKYMGMSLNRSGHRAELSMLGSRGPLLRYSVNYVHSRSFSPAYGINPVTGAVSSFPANVLATCTIDGKVYGQFEGQRQNVVLRNRAIETIPPWANYNNRLIITPDVATDPMGTTTAESLVETADNDYHQVNQDITDIGTTVSFSFYVHPVNTARFLAVGTSTDPGNNSWFNLATGAWGTKSANHSGHWVLPVASTGGYWIGLTSSSENYVILTLVTADNVYAGYAGDGSSGFVLWNAQVESGAFASSPILTAAAAVTRAADVGYWPSASVPAAMTSGSWSTVLRQEWIWEEVTTNMHICSIGSTDFLRWKGATLRFQVYAAGVKVVESATLTLTRFAPVTISVDAAAGSITIAGAASGDGTVVGTPWTWPAGDLYWGSSPTGGNNIFGILTEPY